MFKKLIAYIVCLSTPKALSDAINEAASVDELDAKVIEMAGIPYGPKKKRPDCA